MPETLLLKKSFIQFGIFKYSFMVVGYSRASFFKKFSYCFVR